ncbi:hypothetical protein AGDE_15660 [Angomonas deanei]|uniref:Adenosine-deaminase (Editase) domain containing protein, putative n=1 Tax=Angomonas deanei TaxID=59799 RepID=A0A7G2CHZ4_9TRYP|nr:hypothetical protein AGDE_15660 [Angomonas deanei]CAD2217842.1 Adenosine-deaminase (editase) domain containing protein, putative [Angomonas deanei]|eukprot:EPY18692.1 hypothetical protein AGDE_15660 [Angomonas deanei]
MSCSDKLWKWGVYGLQGRRNGLVVSPIRLSSVCVAVPDDKLPTVGDALRRLNGCLSARTEKVRAAEGGVLVRMFALSEVAPPSGGVPAEECSYSRVSHRLSDEESRKRGRDASGEEWNYRWSDTFTFNMKVGVSQGLNKKTITTLLDSPLAADGEGLDVLRKVVERFPLSPMHFTLLLLEVYATMKLNYSTTTHLPKNCSAREAGLAARAEIETILSGEPSRTFRELLTGGEGGDPPLLWVEK